MVVAVLPNLNKCGSAVVEKLGVILKQEGITAYLPDTIFGADFNTQMKTNFTVLPI